jgi:hypothetical protein
MGRPSTIMTNEKSACTSPAHRTAPMQNLKPYHAIRATSFFRIDQRRSIFKYSWDCDVGKLLSDGGTPFTIHFKRIFPQKTVINHEFWSTSMYGNPPMWWPRFRRASREERVRAVRGQESAVNFSGGIKKAGSEYNLGPVLDKGTTH